MGYIGRKTRERRASRARKRVRRGLAIKQKKNMDDRKKAMVEERAASVRAPAKTSPGRRASGTNSYANGMAIAKTFDRGGSYAKKRTIKSVPRAFSTQFYK